MKYTGAIVTIFQTCQCNAKAYRPTTFHGSTNIFIYNVECKARNDGDDDDDNAQHFYGAIDLFQTSFEYSIFSFCYRGSNQTVPSLYSVNHQARRWLV